MQVVSDGVCYFAKILEKRAFYVEKQVFFC